VAENDTHLIKRTWPTRPATETGGEEGFVRDDVEGTVYVGEGGWGAPLKVNDDNKCWTREGMSL